MKRNRHTAPGKNSSLNDEQVPMGLFCAPKAAVLVDGEFFLKRYCKLTNTTVQDLDPVKVISVMQAMCLRHVCHVHRQLYRIFFYDCSPFQKKLHNPISNKTIDYGRSDIFKFRTAFHEELRKSRKVALRLGHLRDDENARWVINTNKIKDLLTRKIEISDLKPEDIHPNLRQKAVDMKIGIDIASLTLKQQVDTIILISGDGDFVPAAKLARREGIDFIHDPMYQNVQPELYENIDGLHSTFRRYSQDSKEI
jgi:uncharacterized LabA/DUF88 family protein